MRKQLLLMLLLPLLVLLLAQCTTTEKPKAEAKVDVPGELLSMFEPLPAIVDSEANPVTVEKVALGRMLYYDPRLSKAQDISCNSCHDLANYGVDPHPQPVSEGHRRQLGTRNSPTVYNAAGHFVQFWDGRAAHVEEQASGPMMNPVEMAMPAESRIVAVLNSIPEYREQFKKAFPADRKPVTVQNAARAIGAFERKLQTPSRWDDFLKGKQDALTTQEKKGFMTFTELGCQGCHQGTYLGGSMYQKMGLVKRWTITSDLGRYNVTKHEEDKLLFKVPSLRNVEKTGPYYHNGSVPTLTQAIRDMGEYQLGRTLTDGQAEEVATWLKTLTGTIPVEYIRKPQLPPSTASTPKAMMD